MARNDGIDRTSARNVDVPDKDIGNTQKHNEREKDSYRNPDIIPERLSYNVHFKSHPPAIRNCLHRWNPPARSPPVD